MPQTKIQTQTSYTNRGLLTRIWQDLVRPFRMILLVAIIAMAATAGLNAFQAVLIAPAIDDGLNGGGVSVLAYLAAIILAVGVAKGISDYTHNRLMGKVGAKLVAVLQQKMVDKSIYADLQQIHDDGSGRLLTKFLSDSNQVRDAAINAVIGIAKDFLTVIGMIGVMFYQNWQLTFMIIIVFPLSMLPIIYIGKKLRRLAKIVQESLGDITSRLDDLYKALRVIKAYGAEQHSRGQTAALFDRQADLQAKAVEIKARSAPIMEVIGSIAIIILIVAGSYAISSGQNSQGEIMSLLTALLMAYQPMKNLSKLNATLQQGLAAAERCFAVTDITPKVQDPAKPLVPKKLTKANGPALEFDNVTFHYSRKDADRDGAGGVTELPAANQLSFSLPVGDSLALVGPSGGGKSTIINLALRLMDPDQGVIRLAGQDIRALALADLRAHFALVAQEPGIFSASVLENIALADSARAKPHDRARAIEAAKAAEAHEFIMSLPGNYDCQLVEMGAQLSGGQRQRLAIARAIYKDAPILLLDEATASLDSQTEAMIQLALQRLRQGRTTIAIAHRLATIRDMDHILYLEKGRLVETGNHESLMAQNGAYARLCQLQFQ